MKVVLATSNRGKLAEAREILANSPLEIEFIPMWLGDVETGVAHKRDERVEDLGHPTPESCGGEVQYALTGKRFRERANLLHQPSARDRRVIAERFRPNVDLL